MLETEIRTQGKKRKLDFREEVRDYEESKGEGRRSLKQTRTVSTDGTQRHAAWVLVAGWLRFTCEVGRRPFAVQKR